MDDGGENTSTGSGVGSNRVSFLWFGRVARLVVVEVVVENDGEWCDGCASFTSSLSSGCDLGTSTRTMRMA